MLRQKSMLNLADVAVAKRNINNQFLEAVNKAIDWKTIELKIDKVYSKGKRLDGRPAYHGLLLFKMCLLEEWFTIFHNKIDFYVNDSISFTHFVGLSLDDEVPSFTTVSKFRYELKGKGVFQELLEFVKNQLEEKKIQFRKGNLKQAVILHR